MCRRLHTMYVDKPMRGHGLMQAIARVNRVFKDKPGGLVVDYLGLAQELKQALSTYTESGGAGRTDIAQEEAVAAMLEKYEVCCGLFHGFDWSTWTSGSSGSGWRCCPMHRSTSSAQDDGKNRFAKARHRSLEGLCSCGAPRRGDPDPRRRRLLPGGACRLGQAARENRPEPGGPGLRHPADCFQGDRAPDQVIDIFAAAGLKKPDISILSDEFLAEIRGLTHKNVAVELLRKVAERRNQGPLEAELGPVAGVLRDAEEGRLNAYHNRAIATARGDRGTDPAGQGDAGGRRRGEDLGLNDDEIAFYDALAMNESAVQVDGR